MQMDIEKAQEFAERFAEGWDHFLRCANLGNSFLDNKAIVWMNEVGIMNNELMKQKKEGEQDDAQS